MKVNYNFVILILVLGFAFYMLSIKENLEHFVCTTDQIKKAYTSGWFKPRRPEHIQCSKSKDDTGVEREICYNIKYDDKDIKANFKVDGVPEACILELVNTWNW